MATPDLVDSGVDLTDVRISNFRSLRNVEVGLGELTVLVGSNNSGKTSFLDAMYAAIGAGKRLLGIEDVLIETGESSAPLERKITVDLRIRPTADDGSRLNTFPEGSFWTALWGVGISQDQEFHDFMAYRTTLEWSIARGEHVLTRRFLKEWRSFGDWLDGEASDRPVAAMQLEPIALHYIDAKRDLDDDLRRQGSFWRRLTENLGLSAKEIETFEKVLTELNEGIVAKSQVLQHLKSTLSDMQRVVASDGGAVDVTPIARKLRDLSKGVDVTFATTDSQAFPLSRHGMGTRSLASLLVFRAFTSWHQALATSQGDKTHSLLALEEPEAHLHPQAQRALFAQIKSIPGQRIVSTHSPYIAGQARLQDLRLFSKQSGITTASTLDLSPLTPDEIRKLERNVVNSRGDILFARALILFEGSTEEYAFPLWTQLNWGASTHELGFSFVGVGGQDYFPFAWLAKQIGIPWYVFSDGEDKTVNTLKSTMAKLGIKDIHSSNNIVILPKGLDFEGYLIDEGYLDAIEDAITAAEGQGALDKYIQQLDGKEGKRVDGAATTRDYKGPEGRKRAALDKISDRKTRFAEHLAEAITKLKDEKRRIPKKIGELFGAISKHIKINSDSKKTKT